MAQASLALSYPELFRVTGPLPSLVLRAEDMWQRHNQCLEVGAGFPLLTPTMQAGQGFHVIIYMAQKAMQGDD
jgi:hypothetical protein